MSSPTTTPTLRRSPRLATKPQPAYTEPVEEIDEATTKRIQEMFDVLLEESYEKVTRSAETRRIFYRCCKQFRTMFADLSEDDIERRAANAFIHRVYVEPYEPYELNETLYEETRARLRKPKEELYEKRMKLIQEEFKPLVELVIEFEKLKLKVLDALPNVKTAIGSIKLSPRYGTIRTQRVNLIESCIEGINKDYLYLLTNIDKTIRLGYMKLI